MLVLRRRPLSGYEDTMAMHEDKPNQARRFRLGDCVVDMAGHCLRFDGGEVLSLQPKFIEVLACLAESGAAVVSRERLIERVWAGNVYVGEKALTNAIWHLRKALSRSEHTAEAIETVHKGGYALRLSVLWLDGDQAVAPGATESCEAPGRRTGPWIGGVAVLLSVAAFLAWLGLREPEPEALRVRLLTGEPGRELYPRATPDGRQFAYVVVDGQGQRDLYLRDRLQPERPPRRLTADADSEGAGVFSPDGSLLYFSRRKGDGRCELRRLELASGQAATLAGCGEGGPVQLALFPDGKTLAYADEGGEVQLMALDVPGLPVRPLPCREACAAAGEVQHLAVSPEGDRLAFSRRLGDLREDLYLFELSSGRQRRLTTGHVLIRGLTWLPDGKRILFSAENAKRQEAYVVGVADGQSRALGLNGFAAPALVPGTELVLYHDFALRQYLGSLPLAEGAPVLPSALIQSGSSHHSPHYSAAAGRIAYVSNESGHDEIWSAAADGSGRERLSNLRSKTSHPRWSPDGRWIAFRGQGEASEGDAIYVLDVAHKEWRRVPSPFLRHKRPTWAPDGRSLVVAARGEGAEGLYRLRLDGAPPELLVKSARMGVLLASGELYYTRSDARGLWRLAATGGEPSLFLAREIFGTAYNWDADEAGLCFEFRAEGYHHVRCQGWREAQARTLLQAPLGTLADTGAMTLMREQGRLLLTMDEFPQADVRELELGE